MDLMCGGDLSKDQSEGTSPLYVHVEAGNSESSDTRGLQVSYLPYPTWTVVLALRPRHCVSEGLRRRVRVIRLRGSTYAIFCFGRHHDIVNKLTSRSRPLMLTTFSLRETLAAGER